MYTICPSAKLVSTIQLTIPAKEEQMHRFIIYHNTAKDFQNAHKIV